MNKYFVSVIFFLLLGCKQSQVTPLEESESMEEKSLVLAELSSIPNIKIGEIQSKVLRQNVQCIGSIEIPNFEMEAVHSKVSGIVESREFIPGDFVKKGTLLFSVTNPALVEKQRILLENKVSFELATKELERKQRLISGNATSQKSMDEAYAKKEILAAQYYGLRKELSLIGIDVASVEKDQSFQSRVWIKAPSSAFIHEVFVYNGQMIKPEDRLMEMANKEHVHLELQVLSKDVPKLKKGQRIHFTLPNNPKKYRAVIEKLNPMIDKETGTLKVHCHIDQKEIEEIVVGMFINAEIEVDSQKVRGLPLDAVIKEGGDYYAYVVDGEFVKRQKLENVEIIGEFVSFGEIEADEMVIGGAYYIE